MIYHEPYCDLLNPNVTTGCTCDIERCGTMVPRSTFQINLGFLGDNYLQESLLLPSDIYKGRRSVLTPKQAEKRKVRRKMARISRKKNRNRR